ncbi:hypothetical protein ABBQ38_012142 [Trebouxia sp. C0009 RCD-2024]
MLLAKNVNQKHQILKNAISASTLQNRRRSSCFVWESSNQGLPQQIFEGFWSKPRPVCQSNQQANELVCDTGIKHSRDASAKAAASSSPAGHTSRQGPPGYVQLWEAEVAQQELGLPQ